MSANLDLKDVSYPFAALPPLMREAAILIYTSTMAPDAVVSMAVLTAMAAACQGKKTGTTHDFKRRKHSIGYLKENRA